MAFSEKLRLTIDIVTSQASSSLGKLKRDLSSADGAMGKMKASGKAAGDFLKANMATGAVAAGTALVTMGVKSVKAFQDTALGAGELRDSLGVTADEASRLQEVAGDLGIGVDTVEGAIGRMNKTVATTPEAFDDIGAAIVRNKDGTTNVVETFQSAAEAISRIPDAAERAAAAQKIFGRGWQGISELLMQGGEGVADMMAKVEEGKLISDAEIGKARELRDALDQLKGVGEELAVELGGALAPAISDVANAASDAAPAIDLFGKLMEASPFNRRDISDTLKEQARSVKFYADQWGILNEQVLAAAAAGELKDLNKEEMQALEAVLEVLPGVTAAYVNQAAAIDAVVSASEQIQGSVLATAIIESVTAAKDASDAQDAHAESIRGVRDAANEARQEVRDLTAAIIDSAGAAHDTEKAQLAIRDAVDSWRQAQQDANETVDDAATVVDEHAAAVDDAREAELGAADAILVGAAAYAEEAGAREGSRKSAELQIAALKAAQDQYPELRDEIQEYIDRLDEVPTKKETEAHIEKEKAEGNAKAWKESLGEIPLTKETIQYYEKQLAAGNVDAIIEKFGTIPTSITTYHNVISNVQAIIDLIRQLADARASGGGTSDTSSTSSIGGGTSGKGDAPPPNARARRLKGEAADLARQAADLKTMAAALREQAAATEDADEKERLLDKAREASEKRLDLLDEATRKAAKANDIHANQIRKVAAEHDREANALRRNADALRENAEQRRANAAEAAEGLRERAGSFDEFVDAALAVEDAAERAAEARAKAQRALTTEGVTGAQREEAVEEARNAALDLARAEVERERERAERAGKEFTEADEAKALRDSLRRQAAQGGPVGREIRDLIKLMNFPQQFELIKRAERREAKADKRADREEAAARNQDEAARANERAANKLERAADKIDGAVIRFDAEQIGAILREALRRDRSQSNQSIRAGRR